MGDHLRNLRHQVARCAHDERRCARIGHGDDAAFLFHPITRLRLVVAVVGAPAPGPSAEETKGLVLVGVVGGLVFIGEQLRKLIRQFGGVGIFQVKHAQLRHVIDADIQFVDQLFDCGHEFIRSADDKGIGSLIGHRHDA